MDNNLTVNICLCTFRRPQVAETLRSLARLHIKPDWALRIIVADNDDMPSAKSLVEETAKECSLDLTYIHAPARNISVARNACLTAATATLIAFIDDDEIASPGWLGALVTQLSDSKADIVLGPVQAKYAPDCHRWIRDGDFHSTKPAWVDGKIITGYSCNVLWNRNAKALQGLWFEKILGRSGGEDTFFFTNAHKAGAKISYAPDAIVTETVPASRATLSWLLKRSFRSGQTHGLLLLQDGGENPTSRVKNVILAALKADFCWAMSLFHIVRRDRMMYWLLRGTMHMGVVARLCGQREIEQYGQDC